MIALSFQYFHVGKLRLDGFQPPPKVSCPVRKSRHCHLNYGFGRPFLIGSFRPSIRICFDKFGGVVFQSGVFEMLAGLVRQANEELRRPRCVTDEITDVRRIGPLESLPFGGHASE
jgi:hypothetical protein